jgi:PBSX family phage portal protein
MMADEERPDFKLAADLAADSVSEEKGQVRARIIRIPLGAQSDSGRVLDSEALGVRASVEKQEGETAHRPGTSRRLSTEQKFRTLTEQGKVVETPFDLVGLTAMPEESSILSQCIGAYEVNIDSFGHDYIYIGPEEQKDSKPVKDERKRLGNFFKMINPRESFPSLRRKIRRDYETTGNAYFEVLRDLKDEVSILEHLPAHSIRLGPLDKDPIEIEIKMVSSDGEIVKKKTHRWFRRFVQIVDRKKVWFKEFGDPRNIRATDGKVVDDLPEEEQATEVYHFKQYSARTPYGVPRFIGNLPAIRGSRRSEIVNLGYFNRNAIPPMLVMVSGGGLTESSFQKVEKYFKEEAGGLNNYHTVLILEAVPHGTGMDDKGAVHITTKSLQEARLHDALFQDYDQKNMRKVRSSFRLPPIYLGLCHHAETEYLTEIGWRRFEDISEDVRVGTFNRVTSELEFQLPLRRYSYEWDGILLHLKNRGVDACVTPNHRMWMRPYSSGGKYPWKMIEAGQLGSVKGGNGGYIELPITAQQQGVACSTFVLPACPRINARDPNKPSRNPKRDSKRYFRAVQRQSSRAISMDVFLQFLGYFVTEGSTTVRRGLITLSQNDGQVADRMIDVVRKMGFNPSITHSRGRELSITICQTGLWEWLRMHCGTKSHEKRLPRFVFNLSARQLQILIDAMVEGDGSSVIKFATPGVFAFSTTSKQLNDDLHEICVRLGMSLTSRTHVQKDLKWKTAYYSYGHRDTTHLLHPKRQIKEVHYRGKVHCFAVSNETLITRYNGRVLISGNTEDYNFASAQASRVTAEEQVFGVERKDFDDGVNLILRENNIRYHEFYSKGPEIADVDMYTKAIEKFDKVGAMTPNAAIQLANEMLGTELKPIEGEWGDIPFAIVLELARTGKLKGMEEIEKEKQPIPPGLLGGPSPGGVPIKPNGEAKVKSKETPPPEKPGQTERVPGGAGQAERKQAVEIVEGAINQLRGMLTSESSSGE